MSNKLTMSNSGMTYVPSKTLGSLSTDILGSRRQPEVKIIIFGVQTIYFVGAVWFKLLKRCLKKIAA